MRCSQPNPPRQDTEATFHPATFEVGARDARTCQRENGWEHPRMIPAYLEIDPGKGPTGFRFRSSFLHPVLKSWISPGVRVASFSAIERELDRFGECVLRIPAPGGPDGDRRPQCVAAGDGISTDAPRHPFWGKPHAACLCILVRRGLAASPR
jgi:hypothetical protein